MVSGGRSLICLPRATSQVDHFVPTAAAAAASMEPEDAALVAPPMGSSSSCASDGPDLQSLSPCESMLEQRVQTSARRVVAKLLRLNADAIWPPPPLPPRMFSQPPLPQGGQQQLSWGQRGGGTEQGQPQGQPHSHSEELELVQARASLNRRRADATTMRICERLPRIPHRIVSSPLRHAMHTPAERKHRANMHLLFRLFTNLLHLNHHPRHRLPPFMKLQVILVPGRQKP